MNGSIMIRENANSRYQVFDGELLLASFASKTAAEEYARLAANQNVANTDLRKN